MVMICYIHKHVARLSLLTYTQLSFSIYITVQQILTLYFDSAFENEYITATVHRVQL